MEARQDRLTLKWGTLKGWDLHTPEAVRLFKEYVNLGTSMSAAMQDDTPEQKKIICQLIDACDLETVCLDWDGKYVSKEEAKRYVMEYGTKKEAV